MRFKTGEKVEVMNNKEVPVSWRSAEILSRSGDTYTIQYNFYPGMASKQLVEMVSRNFVRPCHSSLQDMKSFITGDIVEVFHQHSWKIAVVLNVLRGKKESKKNKIRCKVSTFKNQYLVRLLGCSEELAIDRSNIRMRQTWHDGKWVPMGKIPQVGDDVIVSKPSTSNCCQKRNFQVPQFNSRVKYQHREDCGNIQNDAAQRESAVISSRSLKRISPYVSSVVEANNGHVHKFRAVEKEGRKQRVVADRVLEKGYSWMHASFASNGLKMMPGFAAFLLALNFGRFSRLLSEICYGYGRSLVSNSLCYLNLFLLLPGLTRCIGTSSPDESTCEHERAVCTKVPFSFRNTSLNYICTILEISVSIENGSFCSDH